MPPQHGMHPSRDATLFRCVTGYSVNVRAASVAAIPSRKDRNITVTFTHNKMLMAWDDTLQSTVLRTVRTGQAACRTTFSVTLPRMACETRLRPWVPMTIKSMR